MDDWLVSVCRDGKVVELYYSQGLTDIDTIRAMHRTCKIEAFLVRRSVEKMEWNVSSTSCHKKVICVATGEIFNSVNELSQSIGVSRGNVYRNIIRGYAINGKYYRYINKSDYE